MDWITTIYYLYNSRKQ